MQTPVCMMTGEQLAMLLSNLKLLVGNTTENKTEGSRASVASPTPSAAPSQPPTASRRAASSTMPSLRLAARLWSMWTRHSRWRRRRNQVRSVNKWSSL